MIKKYRWNTAFYAPNFHDFQNFPGRCPEPRLGGLQRPPRPPAGLRGASRPAALCAACTLFPKNLSQTTLGLWPATPLVQKKTFTMNYRGQSKRHPICRGNYGCFLPTKAAPGAVATVQHVWLEIGFIYSRHFFNETHVFPSVMILFLRKFVRKYSRYYLFWRSSWAVSCTFSPDVSFFHWTFFFLKSRVNSR